MAIQNLHVMDHYEESLKGKDLSVPSQKSWKLIRDRNHGREDNIALSENDRKISYGEMFENWEETARVFSSLDITGENRSRVLVIMPNVAKTCDIDYALDMTGAVVDFIDPTTDLERVKKYISSENITDIFASDLLYLQNIGKNGKRLKDEFGLRNIIIYRDPFLNSYMSKKIDTLSGAIYKFGRFSPVYIRYEDAVKNTKYSAISYDTKGSDSLSLITHTSGTTTGIGKPIPLTDLNRNALIHEYELADFNYKPGMRMLHFIPYFAGYGSVNTTHLGLSQGLELQQVPVLDTREFGKYVKKNKPNVILATPTLILNMIRDPECSNLDLSFISYISVGGGPITISQEEEINEFLAKHGCKETLTKGYGLSEFGGCFITTTDGFNKVGSVGVQLPLTDVILRDNETGELIKDQRKPGKGEALVNTDSMTTGILDGKVVVPSIVIDGKRYIATKDNVKRDEEGKYYFVDRTDRMFTRFDSYNFYPTSVESLIETYYGVKSCYIVPMYDEEHNGNVPRAYIESDGIDDKVAFVKKIVNESFLSNKENSTYVANYRDIPREWVFVDTIPRNTMGKEDYHGIILDGIDGETVRVDVEETNMNVSSVNIYLKNKPVQKIKK